MKKRQRNPLLIEWVYTLGKGEVACSNHASSTILSKFIKHLCGFLFCLLCCIIAFYLILYQIGVMH